MNVDYCFPNKNTQYLKLIINNYETCGLMSKKCSHNGIFNVHNWHYWAVETQEEYEKINFNINLAQIYVWNIKYRFNPLSPSVLYIGH